ncbi:unnamed protein product [Brachionus calyciflorus]|uniref:Man1/Src1-like C-terminal domain-containing protein n=1 Tax=Brachionus calyciflorus TaxID=104777 RepID=A0A813U8K0_9BILA|nr:unnamed protein product [Brachionus calyciflorus]
MSQFSSTFIDDEQLIEELRRYGERNLPTLSTGGSSRSKNKNQLNDSNRDLYIKKLNHYKAKEKAEKNPSKQFQKQLNMTRNSLSTSTKQDYVYAEDDDEDNEQENDVQVIEPERDNDVVHIDSNETQYEYIKVSDAYTSPLSQTRYSHGLFNDNTQNENNFESIGNSSSYYSSATKSPSRDLNYVKLKDRIELDKTLSKYRSEINDILTQTRVKNRSIGSKLLDEDIVYTGTVYNNNPEVTSTDRLQESTTLYCPKTARTSIFDSLKSKFSHQENTEPVSPRLTHRAGLRSKISQNNEPDSTKPATPNKISVFFSQKFIPFVSHSWVQLSKILPYLVLFIFTIIALQYVRVKFSQETFSFVKQMFSSSKSKSDSTSPKLEHYYCADVKDTQCYQTKFLVRDLIDYLRAKSGQIDCSTLVEHNFDKPPLIPLEFTEKCVHINQILDYLTLDRKLIKNMNYKTEAIDSVLKAILRNPHWNLRVLNASYVDTNQIDQITYLMSTVSSKSLGCRFKELVHFLYVRLIMLCSFAITAFLGYLTYKTLRARKIERDQKFFSLIKQVTELVEKHYELSLLDPASIKPYIAISHVYDTLVEPRERTKKKKEWNEVVKFIEDHESRIHLETQFIDGEETLVWKWVVPKHHESVKNFKYVNVSNKDEGIGLANSTMVTQPFSNLSQEKDKESTNDQTQMTGWQGDAFNRSEKLTHSPTECIKIRGMVDQKTIISDPLCESKIRNDILKKCPNAQSDYIVHISCDRKTGCVYVKCNTNEAAGRVYQAINGTWYSGNLLNVKFLRSDRYLERFPESINFNTPLKMVQ